MVDPAIESHHGTGYERSRLFPGGNPSLEFVRSMELLDRLLPRPPARLLDVGGGPGTYAAPLARRGYRVHLVDPVPLHVEQARQAAGRDPAAGFTATGGDARELAEQAGSQDAVLLFGPLYHLTEAAQRRQALAEARRVLRPGGRLLAMAICRFAALLDGLYQDWLDDPHFQPIVDQDLLDGQHRNPDPVGRPEFFTTAYFHTPDGLASEIERAGFTGTAIYGVEGRAGRCARNGQIRTGASRSCSQPAQPRHNPRFSASASTSSPPRPSRNRPSQKRSPCGRSGRPPSLRRCINIQARRLLLSRSRPAGPPTSRRAL